MRLLGEHPEWRAELRRLLLSEEVLELPRIVQRLAEAQERSEERLLRLEASVQALTEAQQRTEKHLAALVEVQQRTEERLSRLEMITQDLSVNQKRMADELTQVKGWALESRYREHVYGHFRWLRKSRVVRPDELSAVEEAYDTGQLTRDEWDQLMALDLLARGRIGRGDKAREIFVAVEVSSVIDVDDVERAHRRAELLRRLGYRAIGGVGGEVIALEAHERARALGVAVAQDGNSQFEEALARLGLAVPDEGE